MIYFKLTNLVCYPPTAKDVGFPAHKIVKLGDDPIIVAGKEYEFSTWDKDGYINFLGGYYGDMSITSTIIKDCLKRLTRTKEVLSLPLNQIPKLINDTEEWVRIYANMVLKNNKVL